MSHFTVLVMTKSTGDVATALAPFYEGLEVEPYRSPVSQHELDRGLEWAAETWAHLLPAGATDDVAAEPADDNAETIEHDSADDEGIDPLDPLTFWEEWTGGSGLFKDEATGEFYVMNTYNPQSRWDWYQIGGRWSGGLKLQPGTSGADGEPSWALGEDYEPEPGRCDQAFKADLDLEGMRAEAEAKADEAYDNFELIVYKWLAEVNESEMLALTDGKTEVPPAYTLLPPTDWIDKFQTVERGSDDHKALEAEREAYWKHPLIAALRDSKLIGFMGMPSEVFGMPREEFVELARLRAIPGFALLDLQGEWHEEGKMGWFGMSSATPETSIEYLRRVNKMIDDAPDDTVFTMVDAHI